MTPDTFEGVTLGGKLDFVQYLGGYLWRTNPRNADEFVSMSQQAGATGTKTGYQFRIINNWERDLF